MSPYFLIGHKLDMISLKVLLDIRSHVLSDDRKSVPIQSADHFPTTLEDYLLSNGQVRQEFIKDIPQ
jgi:hypothetical protein